MTNDGGRPDCSLHRKTGNNEGLEINQSGRQGALHTSRQLPLICVKRMQIDAGGRGGRQRIRQEMMMCRKKTTRIIEGSLPFYLRRQRLKRAICLAVCAACNKLLGPELLALSQRMNRDITSSASSPPSIDINSMWACWPISQSVSSCTFFKYLMIGWSTSTNNIVQGQVESLGAPSWIPLPQHTFLCPVTGV